MTECDVCGEMAEIKEGKTTCDDCELGFTIVGMNLINGSMGKKMQFNVIGIAGKRVHEIRRYVKKATNVTIPVSVASVIYCMNQKSVEEHIYDDPEDAREPDDEYIV